MALFWFLAGMLTTLAALIAILPWLRRSARFGALPALPWQAQLAAVVIAAAALGLYRWLGHPESANRDPGLAPPAADARPMISPEMARGASGLSIGTESGARAGASSMISAIASLEARLAKGGGSAEDWELLAKSFEFLGRPEDAAKARAHQLPALPAPAADAAPGAPGSGTVLRGEVSLAPALRARAVAGATLFIVAKSVDSPGAPVAVYRGSVGTWPFGFTLDDSQAMLPGRNLSSAGRVTVEARISESGQAQPAAGDLKGSSGPINPAEHRPLNILIDQTVP